MTINKVSKFKTFYAQDMGYIKHENNNIIMFLRINWKHVKLVFSESVRISVTSLLNYFGKKKKKSQNG